LKPRTRVVILQHPREGRVAIGTARMAHLALQGSELHEGIAFAELEDLVADPHAAVLFPGPTVAPLGTPPRTLVVVDGTWPQARQMIRRNPMLRRMRRLGLSPASPGAYRIRREPAPECLSTIEAVAAALGELEGDPQRFAALLDAFTFMVDRQLACAGARALPRRRARAGAPPALGPELTCLLRRPEDVVLLHGEANSHGAHERSPGHAELVHLVATRPASGARFEAFVAPRRPLGARTALHLEVDAARLLGGEPVARVLARLEAFFGPTARLCGWGPFAADLLEREGLARRPRVDLRAIVARRLPGHPRGIDRVAALLAPAAQPHPGPSGRAGRMIGLLEAIFAALARLSSDGATT
jgi:DTW domain-containing protein YfiP